VESRDYEGGVNLVKEHCVPPMLIAALFTIAKLWKQPRCPTTDEWIKKMEFYSAVRKNETMWFEGKWMQLEAIMLSKPGSERQRPHVFSHL
jgi:hypothetical protein